ncbi:MAG: UDP-N-acetylglucosamine--N-acetylmuramyl-(pentapeptide) pyrophosphoryl-undecaprenol N-acetylglucosamine transferase, partial [Microthrixaceae bacterium]
LPGLAVASQLVANGHRADSIRFVGSSRGPEANLVPEAGFEVTLLPGRGIERRVSVQSMLAVLGLVAAFFRSIALVAGARPRVVLVLGGYAAAPCAFAAVLLRVPIVVADQNARAGAVNRLVAKFATACAVPFADTDLPKAIVTGNPVREAVLHRAADRDPLQARSELGLPTNRTLLAVFAGSLGATRLNSAVAEAVSGEWATRGDLAVHHVVGVRDWQSGDYEPVAEGGSGAGESGTGGSVVYNPVRY